jgi:hypothetical protein
VGSGTEGGSGDQGTDSQGNEVLLFHDFLRSGWDVASALFVRSKDSSQLMPDLLQLDRKNFRQMDNR